MKLIQILMICDLPPPEIPAISLVGGHNLQISQRPDGAKQILGAVFKKQKFINAASGKVQKVDISGRVKNGHRDIFWAGGLQLRPAHRRRTLPFH
jgi:hypothetical protein